MRLPPTGYDAAGRYRGNVLTLLLTRHGHTDKSEPEQYLGQRLAYISQDSQLAHV